jgi:ornithine--oxo-acid transaminase
MSVFTPGDHGSTFGGNPLAAAVGLEALNILVEDDLSACSASMGDYMLRGLLAIDSAMIKSVRGIGLFIGVEIDPALATAREVCERLMAQGILSKETHGTVVRLAPPLTISRNEIDWALEKISVVLAEMDELRLAS